MGNGTDSMLNPNTGTAQTTGIAPSPWQPIAPTSSSGNFGTGTLAGAGVGAAIGSIIPGVGTVVGAAVGGTIGFIGDLANLWIGSKAAKKQEEQTAQLNAQSKFQYEKETAESRRRYDEQAAEAKKATEWNKFKDEHSMLGNWASNLFAAADKDQNVKNSLVNLWRSK